MTIDDSSNSKMRNSLKYFDAELYPKISFLLCSAVILIVFYKLTPYFETLTHLGEIAYFKTIVFPIIFKIPKLSALLLLPSLVFFLFRKQTAWGKSESDRAVQFLVVGICGILAWYFSFYDYNYYFNQPHLLDRLLIIVLFVLTIFHPGFCCALLIAISITTWQFSYPNFGYFSWTDKKPLFMLLYLFVSFLLTKAVLPKIKYSLFAFLAMTLMASFYFEPGRGKMELNWLVENHTHYISYAAHEMGIWPFIPHDIFVQIVGLMSSGGLVIDIFTIVIEVGAIIALANSRLALIFFCGWIALHLGIFATSGVFFWKWILTDFLFLFLIRKKIFTCHPFNLKNLALATSALLIWFSPNYFHPIKLAWYDVPLTPLYKFYGTTETGKRYELPGSIFGAYSIIFAQGRFYYLDAEVHATSTYASTRDLNIAKRLIAAKTKDDINVIKQDFKKTSKNKFLEEKLEKFLTAYSQNTQPPNSTADFLNTLPSPDHIWTFATDKPKYDFKEPLTKIEIYFQEVFYNDNKRNLITNDLVKTIDLIDSKIR